MSPRHVRVAAAVAAFVLAPATVVLSASAGTFAVEALHSRIAPRPKRPAVDFSAVTSQAIPLTPDMVHELSRFFERSRREAAGGWSQAGAMDRALAAANADALDIADTHVADQALALPAPPAPAATEQGPFALSLMVVDNRWGINLAVSPLPYPDRTACELAGQQWALEVELSGVVSNGRPFICIPQVANVSAVLEQRRTLVTEPRQSP